jgi:CRP/FNR family cyclic AMP-dependent transcriptional regulator
MVGADPMTRSVVSLLRQDPDLGGGLAPADFAAARNTLVASSVTLQPGPWTRSDESIRDGLAKLTLLVLDGLLLSDIVLAGCASAELIGPGDVLCSPERRRNADTMLPVDVELTVLEPTRLVLLDERIRLAYTRWPSVGAALLERMEQRSWRLAKQAAICNLPTVHARLLALFWHLADRWGKVTPDHLLLPLRILHRTLGKMVGAERPTVSLALRELSDAGLVTRRADGAWLLSGDPSEGLELLTRRCHPRAAALVTDSRRSGVERTAGDQEPEPPRVRFQR